MGEDVLQSVIPFEWAIRASEQEQRRAELKDQASLAAETTPFHPDLDDLDEYVDAAFEPMVILSGTIAAGYLVDRLFETIRRVRHSGLLLDVRKGKFEVREHPAVPAGTFLVVSNTGVERLDEPKRSDFRELVESLKEGS